MSKILYMCDECYNSAGCFSKTNDDACGGKAKWRRVKIVELEVEQEEATLESRIDELEKRMDQIDPVERRCANCKWLNKIEFNKGTCSSCYYYGIRLYGVEDVYCTKWELREGDK